MSRPEPDFVWICPNCDEHNPRLFEYYKERAEACGQEHVDYFDSCDHCARGCWVLDQPMANAPDKSRLDQLV